VPRALTAAMGRLNLAYARYLRSHGGDGGVSYARMRLLAELQKPGEPTMSQLAAALSTTPGNITGLVDGLVRDGLVQRRARDGDRRVRRIEVTERGRQVGAALWRRHIRRTATLFHDLDEADQRELLRLVNLVRAALARRGFGEHPGGYGDTLDE
jgi:DNA-binding MarR family transcriptional regulator